jgi:hypothetical protein
MPPWIEDRTTSYPKWRIAVSGVCDLFAVRREAHRMSGCGPTLPTFAKRRVGSYLGTPVVLPT